MKKIIELFIRVEKYMFLILFGAVFGAGLLIKPMYHYDDYPYFAMNTVLDVICILIVLSGAYLVYKYMEEIELKLNLKLIISIFLIAGVFYIFLVPLKPFSDMQYVNEGAIAIAKGDFSALDQMEYFKTFKGNIKTSLFYAIPLIILPKNIFSLRMINLFLYLVCALLTRKIAINVKAKYPNIIFLAILTFVPVFLYINHTYYEFFVFLFALLGINFYVQSKRNIIASTICFSVVIYLRRVGWIFLAAMLIYEGIHMIKAKKEKKGILKIILSGIAAFILSSSMTGITRTLFYDMSYPSYSKWDQFYIGINEEKFGFMDGDFTYDRTLSDVLDRMEEYGPIKMTEILTKKTIYAWMEGTYQAGRYAFGANVTPASEKFLYATPVEKYLSFDNQFTRQFITSFCRAQYLCYFAFMLVFVYRKRKVWSIYDVFQMLFLGTFVILLVYELKSRYVMHCFPFMIILAIQGLSELKNRQKREQSLMQIDKKKVVS